MASKQHDGKWHHACLVIERVGTYNARPGLKNTPMRLVNPETEQDRGSKPIVDHYLGRLGLCTWSKPNLSDMSSWRGYGNNGTLTR
ncbi:hypothetical protein BC938DRAFT_479189 [Jimgerdemannia flammicorona]|uniref:Uncharacterized protein n=1 Tax=Jimgerdemannia flammicorona TaxID=994334 RepID=A0A433QXX5_9FUNG|nr:hypothetical protein BC938DRAFT_479189 [Jimgerdemannia flammicorona]